MVKVFITTNYFSDHTLACSRLGKSFTPLAIDFCSKAVQIFCNASFNSRIVLYSKMFMATANSKDVG